VAAATVRVMADVPPSGQQAGRTITAVLEDGPLKGRRLETEPVEGRPPKTIDVPDVDGTTCRYCLAEWMQSGPSAVYTFLYRV
jgi:hypothetical protein